VRNIELDFADGAALRFAARSTECDALKEFREGLTLLHNRYSARALIHFLRASELEKGNPYFLSYLGLTLALAHQKWAEAEELCTSALRMRRNQPQLYLNLAQVQLCRDNKEEAYETLVAGVQYTGRDPRLVRALSRFGTRRRPLLPFLSRRHRLNHYFGRIRSLAYRVLRVA